MPGNAAARPNFKAAAAWPSRELPSETQKLECRRAGRHMCRRHVTSTLQIPLMPSTVSEHYRALVAQGEIERDAAQEAIAARLARLEERLAQHRLSRKSSHLGWLFAKKIPGRANQGTLHPRRRRARQDHADGLVLRRKRGEAETPRAFSRVHGRRARARACGIARRSNRARSPTTIRSASPPPRSPRKPGSSASTNSTSPTSPTR